MIHLGQYSSQYIFVVFSLYQQRLTLLNFFSSPFAQLIGFVHYIMQFGWLTIGRNSHLCRAEQCMWMEEKELYIM